MSWILWFRVHEQLRTAIWSVPCACGLGGLLAGMLVWRLDRWAGFTLLDFKHDAATALTAAIVGATITFVGTAFTVLLVAAQFASNQLTPRALKVSLSDPLYRVALGLFVGTFVFAMVILARISEEFVPQLGVALATGLTAVSLVMYLVLIGHLGRSLRPVNVVTRVGREGRRMLDRMYRDPVKRADQALAVDAIAAPEPTRTVRHPGPPGILLGVDPAGLVAEAQRCNAQVVLVPSVGDFVRSGALLFRLFESGVPMNERLLLRSVATGSERIMDQDTRFAFRILVDVAIRALSPAINDPTSAVMAIDQIHELLAYLGPRRLDVGQHRDAAGVVRVTVEMPNWEDCVSLAVDEIRHFGADSVQITRRLRAMLEDLLEILPGARQAAIQHQLKLLEHAIERVFPDAEDRERASQPDQQGIGSSPRSPSRAGGR